MAIFDEVNLVVSDRTASLAVYRRLGLGLPEGAEPEVGDEPGDHIDARSADGGASFELDGNDVGLMSPRDPARVP